ncbi:MAG: hypothetical protein AMXMBFR13_08820 [Phycisphaerae bacterium]
MAAGATGLGGFNLPGTHTRFTRIYLIPLCLLTGAGPAVARAEGSAEQRLVVAAQTAGVERTGVRMLLEALAASGSNWTLAEDTDVAQASIVVGTAQSNRFIADLARTWGLAELGDEGFAAGAIPGDAQGRFAIAGGGARGVLYGCAAVAERVRRGDKLAAIKLREKPALRDRILWTWNGPKRQDGGFFSLDVMREPAKHEHFRELGRYLASARINGLGIWAASNARPDTPDAGLEVREAYRRFTRFLREEYGIDTWLFCIYELERGVPVPITGWPICPFDERVIAHWRERVERLVRETPDLRGIIMAGAGGDWIRGPFECECPRCRKHTDRELLVEAMRMIGEPWAAAGGRIIWKAVTDRPTLVKSEVEHFANLDGVMPEYVSIAHKTFYKDFRPPHPLQPIFYAHEDDPGRMRPYLLEFQLYGEYRGGTDFPCVMIDRWAQVAPLMSRKGYQGAIGVCSFAGKEAWDHPLNMANWYAFGRYAWDPNASPADVYRGWAVETFGPDVADRVIKIARTSYQASMKLMFFRGVMIQNHSKLPTIDYELESSLVGPWHDIPKAPEGHWGRAHDVSMYPPEVAESIRQDPSLLLWAHRVPITPELCDEAIAQTAEALKLVKQMADEWAALPHAGWEGLHGRVAEQFGRNIVDAEVWHEDIRLYFDFKAGRLTRTELKSRIDRIRETYDPRKGSGLIRRTFQNFLDEWMQVYEGKTQRRSMEGKFYNPRGEALLPGFAPEP